MKTEVWCAESVADKLELSLDELISRAGPTPPVVKTRSASSGVATKRRRQPAAAKVERLLPSDAALLSTEIFTRENGDVVIRLKQTEIVVVHSATGDMVLSSGGFRTFLTKTVINQALQPLGLKVFQIEERGSEWQVSDGRSYLETFTDNMIIRQAGAFSRQQQLARGSVMMQFLQQRKTTVEAMLKRRRMKSTEPRSS